MDYLTQDTGLYVFSCLWEFIPTFITKNFVKSLLNKPLTKIDDEGNETELEISNEPKEKSKLNISIEEIFSICVNEFEKKILKLILKNKKVNRTKIAKELGVSPQYISLKLKDLRKRLKILLVKQSIRGILLVEAKIMINKDKVHLNSRKMVN